MSPDTPSPEAARAETMAFGLPRTILVPLDGSRLATAAIDYASTLAAATGAELVLFTVISGNEKVALAEFAANEGITVDEAAAAHLRRLASTVPDQIAVDHHHAHCASAATAIVDHVTEHGISLIVMASHGRSGVGRWLLGSTTDKVVQTSPVPVVVVPVRT